MCILQNKEGNVIPVFYDIDGSKVIATPNSNYNQGETYTLWIKDVKGLNGEVLTQNVKMEFTIEEN